MKKTKITYWVVTAILCGFFIFSSYSNIVSAPEAIEVFKHLGYPVYLLPFLGVAKTLGSITILIPAMPPRLKEWAYAGLFFDMTGAAYSGISVGDPLQLWITMLVIVYAFLFGSYYLHHKLLKEKAL
ncbi:DoxX family protein [Mucilaginibacter gynuensis]|uniref:DoxX family protein n=1 Tax=Mucilaginibacter gynuensis TaxID=1302236 RepID=A0ABP8GHT5_9SPHI